MSTVVQTDQTDHIWVDQTILIFLEVTERS